MPKFLNEPLAGYQISPSLLLKSLPIRAPNGVVTHHTMGLSIGYNKEVPVDLLRCTVLGEYEANFLMNFNSPLLRSSHSFLSSLLGLPPSWNSLVAVQHTFSCCPCWLCQPMLTCTFLCPAVPVAASSLTFSYLVYTALPP